MRELQKRQKFKKRMYSLPALLALFIFTLFIIRGTYGVMSKKNESAERLETLEAKIQELEDRRAELEKNINRLDTKEGIDEEIKEKFSVSRDGEQVAIIVDEKISSTTTDKSTLPWYKKWWQMLQNLW